MSSSRRTSRIIKAGEATLHAPQGFTFGRLQADVSSQGSPPAVSGFVPLSLGSGPAGLGLPDSAASVAEDPDPPMPSLEGMVVLSEEEFQAKVDEIYRNGMDEGRRQAERGLANVFKSLRDGVSALTGLRSRVLKESEEDLLRLAVMIARKIVQQEIAQDPAILAAIIAAAVGGCTERDRVVVRLNPGDYGVVAANRQTFLAGVDDTPITLTPDEGVGPGGCLVETATGTVDARIESQLDEICRTLLEERSAPAEMAPPALPEPEHRPELPLPAVDDVIPSFSAQGTWLKGDEDATRADG